MRNQRRLGAIFTVAMLGVLVSHGQNAATQLTAPKLADLFGQSDVVACISFRTGAIDDRQLVTQGVNVLLVFKGVNLSEPLFLVRDKQMTGGEYFVFLRETFNDGGPGMKTKALLIDGKLVSAYKPIARPAIMRVEHVCVFDKEPNGPCDYGVKVPTEITLPEGLKTYSPEPTEKPNDGVRWVRRDALISVLRGFARK